MKPRLGVGLAILLVAIAAALLPHGRDTPAVGGYFAARVVSTAPGWFHVFFDDGRGFRASRSSQTDQPLVVGENEIRLPIPRGRLVGLRIDPMDRPGTVTLSAVQITDRVGRLLHALDPAKIQPVHDIAEIVRTDAAIRIETKAEARDPQLIARLDHAIVVGPDDAPAWWVRVLIFLAVAGVHVLAIALWIRSDWAPVPRRWFVDVAAAAGALVAVIVVVRLNLDRDGDPARPFQFEVDLATSLSGHTQLFYDAGDGFNEGHAERRSVGGEMRNATIVFPIPAGTYRGFRLDPMNGVGRAVIGRARIVDRFDGLVIRQFGPEEFRPSNDIATAERVAGGLSVETTPGGFDPWLTVDLGAPLPLQVSRPNVLLQTAATAIVGTAALLWACIAAEWILLRSDSGRRATTAMLGAVAHRPRACLALVALLGTLVCCYPVVFLGKSLFSPNYETALLYSGIPALPGMTDLTIENARGADRGALLWQHLPYSAVQHHAIFHDGELPLWNRTASCGNVLLGQGQSMLGDPFHLVVVGADGAAWAWDLKYVVARFLFACGCGWVVFAVTRRFGPAALMAGTAAFMGFFTYRLNHPAYVSFCYAPWMIVAWVEFARAGSMPLAWRWLLLLFGATWCELASGTVKEATMLVASIHIAGLAAWLGSRKPPALRLQTGFALALVGICGVLAIAPWWVTLMRTLGDAWTAYDGPNVSRFPTYLFIGFFDGIFLSESHPDRWVVGPSANFLLLAGLLWLAAGPRAVARDATTAVFLAGLVVSLSLAFGVPCIPTSWILAIPGLRSVGHVFNTFSCVAIMLALVPAGRGLASALGPEGAGLTRRTTAVAALVLGASLAGYIWRVYPAWHARAGTGGWLAVAAGRPYFFASIGLLAGGTVGLILWAHLRRTSGVPASVPPLILAASLVALLSRHGQTVAAGNDDYFLSPVGRVDLRADSPAVDWLKARTQEPARVFGLGGNLYPGFGSFYGLEGVNAADGIQSRAYHELAKAGGLVRGVDWSFAYETGGLADKQRIFDLLNTGYFVAASGMRAPWPWVRPVFNDDLAVFESPTRWPRAFFVRHVSIYTTADELVARVNQGDGRPFAAMLAGDAAAIGPLVSSPGDDAPIAATDYHLTSNSTSFAIEATGPGIAVLHETWWPRHFRATLDGVPVPYVRVNHAFRGVAIATAGRHVVRFVYWPEWMTPAFLLSATGFAVLAGVAFVAFRRTPRSAS